MIQTGNHPTGVGQMSTPLVAPAISNAIMQLTGVRLRHTPFTPDRVTIERARPKATDRQNRYCQASLADAPRMQMTPRLSKRPASTTMAQPAK